MWRGVAWRLAMVGSSFEVKNLDVFMPFPELFSKAILHG